MPDLSLIPARIRSAWNNSVAQLHRVGINDNALLMGFAAAVGTVSALGVVTFYKMIDVAYTVFYRIPAERVTRGVFFGYRPILTALGLISAAWIMRRLGRGDDSNNVPDVQVAVARNGGYLGTRGALVRTLASAVTLGSGASAGSEGPVAVLGSAIGSRLARTFQFNSNQVRVLVGAGAGAAIAAAFNAPLAGAFFALEEIIGTFSAVAFAPIVVSSVLGAVVSRAFFGNHPAFPVPQQYSFHLSTEIFLLFPLLGLVAGVTAAFFIKTYFKARDVAAKFRFSLVREIVGGLLVGLMVFASKGLLVGYGHLAVRVDIFGRMAWYTLALLAIGKILSTSITLNFGGSGGVFTPSLYLGAATGGAFGVAAAKMLPLLHISPEAYALVGMGAMVAAATDAPITGILIVFEMTNDYAIMPALMLVVVIAVVMCRRLEPDSLYSGYLRRKGESIPHGVERDVLSHLRVADVFEPCPTIRSNAPLPEVLEHITRGIRTDLPVVGADDKLQGLITFAELARAAHEQDTLGALIVASDLAIPVEAVMPQDSLISVIQKMSARGVAGLPVLDPKTGKLIGIVARSHILDAYSKHGSD